jgi:hypothetical protein
VADQTDNPLTQRAESIAEQNRAFQRELTAAVSQVQTDAGTALARLEQCWKVAEKLEQDEVAFLEQMGEWGRQQIAQAKNSWKENRLQMLFAKAQRFLRQGNYDATQSTIDTARSYIPNAGHPAEAMLDQLEIMVIQAKG